MYLDHVTAAFIRKYGIQPLLTDSDSFNDVLRSFPKLPKKEYEEKIYDSEWVVKDEEMVKLGFADKFVQLKCNDYVNLLAPELCSN